MNLQLLLIHLFVLYVLNLYLSPVYERLQNYWSSRNLDDVHELIKEGVDLRTNNDLAIKAAAVMGHNHIVEELFRKGSNSSNVINFILKTAAKRGNLDLVNFALESRKYNQDLRDVAIAEAVRFNNLNIVESLYDSRYTSLGYREYLAKLAWLKGHYRILFYFTFERGVKFDFKITEILKWASRLGHIEIVKLLFRMEEILFGMCNFADVHASNDYALRWASRNGHIDVVKLLIEKGANVHAEKDEAIRWASRNGHADVVKVLIENGAFAYVRVKNDYALKWARRNGHADVVKILIDKADETRRNDHKGESDHAKHDEASI